MNFRPFSWHKSANVAVFPTKIPKARMNSVAPCSFCSFYDVTCIEIAVLRSGAAYAHSLASARATWRAFLSSVE